MRKFFLIVMVLVVALSTTACSITNQIGPPKDDGKTYWRVGSNIDVNWEHAPKAVYNEDGSFKNRGEVTELLFLVKPKWSVVPISYQVAEPNTQYLEISDNGVTVYVAEPDLLEKLENDEQIESIRLWMPFVDKNDEIWCWEFVLTSDYRYGASNLIQYPGPDQTLHTGIENSILPWKPGPLCFGFVLTRRN